MSPPQVLMRIKQPRPPIASIITVPSALISCCINKISITAVSSLSVSKRFVTEQYIPSDVFSIKSALFEAPSILGISLTLTPPPDEFISSDVGTASSSYPSKSSAKFILSSAKITC